MKPAAVVFGAFLCVLGGALAARAQETLGPSGPIIDPTATTAADPSGAKRFLADPGELVTLYGSRRFDPYYEPGRQPPPTDPVTGWPLDWSFGPFTLVGGFRSPFAFRFNPHGFGFNRSFYRPWYVPYGYGYGWGYRYPFGFYPWHAYDRYRPWYLDSGHGWHPPYFDYGPSFHSESAIVFPPDEFGGCFFW